MNDVKIPIGSGGEDGRSVDVPQVLANQSTLEGILSVAYFWAGAVAVIVIVIAGFFYVTANGNAQQIERAKNAILGGVIGLVVIMVAFVITQLVINISQSA